MTDDIYPAFQGLVHLGRSARARVSKALAPWRARRKARSYIRQLDVQIGESGYVSRTGRADWGQIDGLISSAETSRTRADDAYNIGNLEESKRWADRGLATMRTVRSLLPDNVSLRDT
jgi:hypothetical protein